MKGKRVLALGLAMAMTLSLNVPGVNAATETDSADGSAVSLTKTEQISMATGTKQNGKYVEDTGQLPGTNRTFFDDDTDIYDWFDISGCVAEGVQDRSEYYFQYVSNGYKDTEDYKVVEEDGYWDSRKKSYEPQIYISTEEYDKLDAAEKANYRAVTAEEQFTCAISSGARVVQVNAEELELGFNYLDMHNIPRGSVEPVTDYEKNSKYPKTNPVIMTEDVMATGNSFNGTGVSDLFLYSHLTLFSTTGCVIRHAGFDVGGCTDVIVRNFRLEGMYEWDDKYTDSTSYKSYDSHKDYGWCNFSLNDSDNIWVDHCTFGFAYDGNLDIKNGSSVSITWCQFGVQDLNVPEDEAKMGADNKLEKTTLWNQSKGCELWKNILYMEEFYQNYKAGKTNGYKFQDYTLFRDAGATPKQLFDYVAFHSKVHLCGSGETSFYTNVQEKISLGYNYYKSVIQRIPMVRQGNGHMYNCIVDNTEWQKNVNDFKQWDDAWKIMYRGSISVNNPRDGATVGSDTCIFREVNPSSGTEYQGQDTGNITAGDDWGKIYSPMVNHSLVVNSRIEKMDGTNYTGSSWDNNGSNPLTRGWKWRDKASLGDFKWSKWKNQDEFATFSEITNQLEGDKQKLLNYCKGNPNAYYANYYEGSDSLGYDYKCFKLADLEEKLMQYGGAQKNLFGDAGKASDYIRTYSEKTANENYAKRVYINANGGTVSTDAGELLGDEYFIKKGESVTLPAAETVKRNGYAFVGWAPGHYENGQLVLGAQLDNPVVIEAPADAEGCTEEFYYAIWEKEKYSLSFNTMGGSPAEIASIEGYEYRDRISTKGSLPADPTRTGYKFIGWYEYNPETEAYETKKYTNSSLITGNTTLYAKWEIAADATKHTVRFNPNEGSVSMESSQAPDGGTLVIVPTPKRAGYIFLGWYTDADCTQAFDPAAAIKADMTLYAKWEAATVKVSFETNGGTEIAAVDVNIGSPLAEVTPPTKKDYVFAGWYTDADLTQAFDAAAAIEANITLYAAWALKGDVNGDGEVSATDAQLILQSDVGLMEFTDLQKLVADVNGDHEVSATDAQLVLQLDVGLLNSFDDKAAAE